MADINAILSKGTNFNLNDIRIPDPTNEVADQILATDGEGGYKLSSELGGVKSLNGASGDLEYHRISDYGIRDAYINGKQVVLGQNVVNCITKEDVAGLAPKSTTLSGYGIQDAKIANGKVKLGSDEIEPLVADSHEKDVQFKTVEAGITYTTTEPTTDNTDGLKFVVLSTEPSHKYNGWVYVITE